MTVRHEHLAAGLDARLGARRAPRRGAVRSDVSLHAARAPASGPRHTLHAPVPMPPRPTPSDPPPAKREEPRQESPKQKSEPPDDSKPAPIRGKNGRKR